jgi:amidase
MKRAVLTLVVGAALLVFAPMGPAVAQQQGAGSARLNLVEATVDDLQKAIQTDLVTIEQLTNMYLARIAAYDDAGPGVNAFLHVNANAAAEASELDTLRHPGIARTPQYGRPVLL